MSRKPKSNQIEVLESRIAPAALTNFVQAPVGSPILLEAGTAHAGIAVGGAYLVHVEAGKALVFTTDLNGNGQIDFNEITGIAAGNGLQMTLFTDLHGDIVTNLKSDGTLSDSDGKPSNNDPVLKGDGKVLLNSHIDRITLRSLTTDDFDVNTVGDVNGDGVVDNNDLTAAVNNHLALSSYSIFGNILAGGGVGTADGTGGVIIDIAGKGLQSSKFSGDIGGDIYYDSQPEIGSILVGTAASGEFFSFGTNHAVSHTLNLADSKTFDIMGNLSLFVPLTGTSGGDINGVHAQNGPGDVTGSVLFSLGTLHAGDGGFGGAGGNISNVRINGDVGGYDIIAGNGGRGLTGGAGGSILNFSDLGSITSQVHIVSGDGGQGLTGSGGNGGNAVLGTMNIFGGLSLQLGNGGNGFAAGGNGASLATGKFTAPEAKTPVGLSMTGTMHDPTTGSTENIGTVSGIDFNGDGIGDVIYTNSQPDQLVVMFGDGLGGFYTDANGGNPPLDGSGNVIKSLEPTFLNAPVNPSAVTVGDFNGDGRPDIAVASADGGANGGVSIILSKFTDTNHNGKFDLPDEFSGFTQPHHVTLPSLFSYQGNSVGPFLRSGAAITALAAGDFNGDGVTDLAVVADYTTPVTHVIEHTVVVLAGDPQVVGTADFGSGPLPVTPGTFFADFGTALAPQVPFFMLGVASAAPLLKATHLQTSDNHDVIVAARVGDDHLTIVDDYAQSPANPTPTATQLVATSIGLGDVDTNRAVGGDKISPTAAHVLDFTVLDLSSGANPSDGNADFAVLTSAPKNFLVILQGNGTGGAAVVSGTGDQAGIALVGGGSVGLSPNSDLRRIVTTDADGDGQMNDVAIYDISTLPTPPNVVELNLTNGTAFGNNGTFGGATVFAETPFPTVSLPKNNNIVAFDSYRPDLGDPTVFAYGNIDPTNTFPQPDWNFTSSNLSVLDFGELTNNGFFFNAGNGGNAVVGTGGNGGHFGGPLTITNGVVTPSLSFQFPLDVAFGGGNGIIITGGIGGNGFKSGGAGGGITGVEVTYSSASFYSSVQMIGGVGGNGIAGSGGNGGTISNNVIATGELFQGGNGGNGTFGGNGGSVIGNGVKGFYDTQDLVIAVHGGDGGGGIKSGGSGGSILNFSSLFIPLNGGESGSLDFSGGIGGNAVSGAGGHGGSVVNSSPSTVTNNLAGPISVIAGAGGKGFSGGGGGSITNFINKPTSQGIIPTIVTLISGDGGGGIGGNGGAGGDISSATADGKAFDSDLSQSLINRIIAGNGGDSFGANGGSGGNVNSVTSTATRGAAVAAAGAGGFGLLNGGLGGSVNSSEINASLPTGEKVLIVGGKGGDVYGFLANDQTDIVQVDRSFGGKAAVGGNGGSINSYLQRGSIATRVDLIAGNGGSTLNYGTSQDIAKDVHVGKGGSITNAQLEGSIGNIDPSVPIKAYNDTTGDYHVDITMATFIHQVALGATDPLDPAAIQGLTDANGNVGIIAGAAGRVKNDQPATPGINGSVNGLTTRNIMSMVAGGIDRIAAVQSASNINLTLLNGDKGTDKAPTNSFDYYDAQGNVVHSSTPSAVPLGGALIDGYIVTATEIPGLPPGNRVVVPA